MVLGGGVQLEWRMIVKGRPFYVFKKIKPINNFNGTKFTKLLFRHVSLEIPRIHPRQSTHLVSERQTEDQNLQKYPQ